MGRQLSFCASLRKNSTQRSFYLPKGAWWNHATSARIEGGRKIITVPAALDTLPLFVKAGAIVPMDPIRQHTKEVRNEPTTLFMYPGADGQFHFYDDDGSSFKYESGNFMRVLCEWNDRARTLTLTRDPKGREGVGRTLRVRPVDTSAMQSVTLKEGSSRIQF